MKTTSLNTLVLYNTASPAFPEWRERVRMYLEHFGIPWEGIDLLRQPLPNNLAQRPLLVFGHPYLDLNTHRLGGAGIQCLRDLLRDGTGILSFDPQLSNLVVGQVEGGGFTAGGVEIANGGHVITSYHDPGQAFSFAREIQARSIPGEPLLKADEHTFLSTVGFDKGRMVAWASTEWMDSHILGPMSGLDDLFWRGLVWAARKPFYLRGLPPLVTMRVDDVAGRGDLWNRSTLYWVDDCTQLGWKPWLGLFIYNNSPETVGQLKAFTAARQVTVFPHAFGRPNRGEETNFYYYQDALPLRSNSYDEFIYFDHNHGVPWPDSEAERGLLAADRWLKAQELPISRVALPHWYEMGANTVRHVHEQWGCDMLGKVGDADTPLAPGIKWLPLGPFRQHEPPGECFPFTPDERGNRPVYYADFVNLQGYRFFNSLTEIRDDAGYEWRPDNDVASTVARGVRQLRRALNNMALASLFTHETDYIYKIRPDNWRAIMEGITREIAAYHPRLVTLDEGMQVLRATKTSRLEGVGADTSGALTASFKGQADCATTLSLFDNDLLSDQPIDVPAFEHRLEVTID